jgi:hypothetical protein
MMMRASQPAVLVVKMLEATTGNALSNLKENVSVLQDLSSGSA